MGEKGTALLKVLLRLVDVPAVEEAITISSEVLNVMKIMILQKCEKS